ncbi:hypothetical protein [Actinophytocola sp. NPDC049390]|uniref:hypothetical protein n=1 Tax=Actinophytocola sp. NPDC049390 TaxID=3363894 RepID=UPI00378BE6B8
MILSRAVGPPLLICHLVQAVLLFVAIGVNWRKERVSSFCELSAVVSDRLGPRGLAHAAHRRAPIGAAID